MRATKASVIVLTFVIVAVYVAKIADLLSVGNGAITHRNDTDGYVRNRDANSQVPNDELRHLVWFLQISDIHLSQFIYPERVQELREFCTKTVLAVHPHVVLATGDLTDGKTADQVGSREQEQEWKMYYDALLQTGVMNVTKWLDVRGNHDDFNVPSISSKENFFRTYSSQGRLFPKSYHYKLENEGEVYSFVALDACPEPGARRPFNFAGLLSSHDMTELTKFSEESSNSSATIWFGHYPTSCILSPSPGVRHLMRNSVAYLCGHYHTFGGLIHHMYALQKSGNLELELADWKDNRAFRLGAIDHGLFSFVDVHHNEWPIVLVTNPKDALLSAPAVEPLFRMEDSSHIRVLAFSPGGIEKVRVKIDNGQWVSCTHVEGPLFVAKWNPKLYVKDLHIVSAHAKDKHGRESIIEHYFSLDGSRESFGLLARIVLMTKLQAVMQVVFGLTVVLATVPLCFVRIMFFLQRVGRIRRPNCCCWMLETILRRLWLMATIDRFFYPLLFMALYVPLGPWFIGEILEGHVGVVFAWGMFVMGSFIPGGMTFAFGYIHMWLFNISIMVALSHCLDVRYMRIAKNKQPSMVLSTLAHIPMLTVLGLNIYFTYLLLLAYGSMAFLIGPLKTWSILVGLYLWYQASTLPLHVMRHVDAVFPVSSKRDEGERISLRDAIHDNH